MNDDSFIGLTQSTRATSRAAGWRPSDQRERVMRLVSGDKHTTHAALPPSDAEKRQPTLCIIKNLTSQVRYGEIAGT